MKNRLLVVLLLTVCVFAGCGDKSKSRPKPDVSKIEVDARLQRFDQDIFAAGQSGFSDEALSGMRNKYGSFFDFYVSQFVIGPRQPGDTANIEKDALQKFVTDAYINRIQRAIDARFSSTKDIDEELNQALKYFKYYFPEAQVPKVVAINSGFSVGAFTYEKDLLGIGLDQYLGPGYADYDSAGVFQYLQHKMRREYITRNSMEVLYNFYFGEEELSRGKNLVEAMVEKGKKIYFLSYMLPDAPDSLLVGFTQKQTTWCEQNEVDIWKFLNDKDLLYKDNYMDQKRYLDEGPGITGMPPEAPGSIGSWIGLQIVRQFAKETGNKIPLKDLLTKYDAKTILLKARYRPVKSVF
ncbi:MAG TPA: hypothetical protein VK154_06035 [Chitinophagales bacterium]|nr:hypothetical protein [Chitinophagales bacterium]